MGNAIVVPLLKSVTLAKAIIWISLIDEKLKLTNKIIGAKFLIDVDHFGHWGTRGKCVDKCPDDLMTDCMCMFQYFSFIDAILPTL